MRAPSTPDAFVPSQIQKRLNRRLTQINADQPLAKRIALSVLSAEY